MRMLIALIHIEYLNQLTSNLKKYIHSISVTNIIFINRIRKFHIISEIILQQHNTPPKKTTNNLRSLYEKILYDNRNFLNLSFFMINLITRVIPIYYYILY